MIHFVLIRHGETAYTREKRYQGSTNTTLTPKGRKQIERFATEVTKYGPDVVFTSSLARAKESAAILTKKLKKKPKVDKRLNELSFGLWEGHTANELMEDPQSGYTDWMKGKLVKPRNGESIASLQKRIQSFIKDCRNKYAGKKIVIVTHGGPIRMFLVELLKLERTYLYQFRVDPGTITVVGDYQYTKQLIQINSPVPNKGLVPSGCV